MEFTDANYSVADIIIDMCAWECWAGGLWCKVAWLSVTRC